MLLFCLPLVFALEYCVRPALRNAPSWNRSGPSTMLAVFVTFRSRPLFPGIFFGSSKFSLAKSEGSSHVSPLMTFVSSVAYSRSCYLLTLRPAATLSSLSSLQMSLKTTIHSSGERTPPRGKPLVTPRGSSETTPFGFLSLSLNLLERIRT